MRLKILADDLGVHRVFNDGALTAGAIRVTPGGAIARFARSGRPHRGGGACGAPRLTVPATPAAARRGQYYHADLLGLAVVSEGGEARSARLRPLTFGAGDVIEIARPDGKRFMVPMTTQAVPRWDDRTLVVSDGWAE